MSQPMHFKDLPPARVKKFNRIGAHDHILCTHQRCGARLGFIGRAWKYAPHFLLVRGEEFLVATPRKYDHFTPEIEAEVGFFPDRRDGVWRRSKRVADQMKRGQRIYRRRVTTWLPLIDFYDGKWESAGPPVQSIIKLLPVAAQCPECARTSVIEPESLGILDQFTLDPVQDLAEGRDRLQSAQSKFDHLQEMDSHKVFAQSNDNEEILRLLDEFHLEKRRRLVALCTPG